MNVSHDLSIISLVSQASFLAQLVMALLAALSVMSWYWIFRKSFQIRGARNKTNTFERDFWSGGDLNSLYRSSPALFSLDNDGAGFSWIDANDSSSNVFSFLRIGAGGEKLACLANFSAVPHHSYKVGLPHAGEWTERLNTDAGVYAGSGVGNLGSVTAVDKPWHGQPASASVTLPPLGAVYLVPSEEA